MNERTPCTPEHSEHPEHRERSEHSEHHRSCVRLFEGEGEVIRWGLRTLSRNVGTIGIMGAMRLLAREG